MTTARTPFRLVIATILLVGAAACADTTGPTRPSHTDVDFAHTMWLAQRTPSYSFEWAWAPPWETTINYLKVTVTNGVVTLVQNQDGSVNGSHLPTIDEIWDRILSARADDELNLARFDLYSGMPVETDYGEWELDGGVHLLLRNYRRK